MLFSARACRVLQIATLVAALPANVLADDLYRLAFHLSLEAGEPVAKVSLTLTQDTSLLREARFRAPPDRFSDFVADGNLSRDGDFVTWRPPAEGGRIEFRTDLENRRNGGRFDSLVTNDWALFRADDAFPPARIRQRAGARSRSSLSVSLPDGWSIITPFAKGPADNFVIENPARAFDRPTGWLIAGKLGRRKDTIAGMEVSVAAPVGAGVERISMLALLRWTLPYLEREIERLPTRISIVSAGDPMWRGGLSAPNSVYVHADRPLLSENSTSTLLHEVVHVLMPVDTEADQDWIDEGVAEYVTLRLLRDSGTISPKRFQKALDGFGERASPVAAGLNTRSAAGNVRARAVTIFAELDAEIRRLTDGEADLYDLLRRTRQAGQPLDIDRLRATALDLTGATEIESLPADGP